MQIGIWDRITLRVIPQAQLGSLGVYASCDPAARKGKVHLRMETPPKDTRVRVALEQKGKVVVEQTLAASQTIELACPAVEFWNPWELGTQTTYTARVQLLDASGAVLDEAVRTVGFRDIQWKPCENSPTGALPWICCVNGTPLFLQGIDWTPIRPNFADVTEADYRLRLEMYRGLGMNVLRVWGGAVLEKEIFYRLCDELGLLVWQEFPICSSGTDNWPPEEPTVIEQVREIARSYIQRRQHHASLFQWCGGNELQGGLDGSKTGCGKPVDMTHPMMAAMGEEVARLDPTRRFVPTSASGPRFTVDEKDFGKGLHHDVHGPWNQTGSFEEWQRYWDNDDALFRSEVGVPSSGPVDILRSYGGDQVLPANLTNQLWRHVSVWWIQWDTYLAEGGDAGSVEQYVQWSHSRQAKALCYAIAATRKRFPRCGGIILWMGHDAFPCPSNTSIVDFLGRPKPAATAIGALRRTRTAQPVAQPLWVDGAPGGLGTADADRPSITVYLPEADKATGAAMVICPGGGYGDLMMSYEGHDIARWLNAHGVTGIVLKYRVSPYRHPIEMNDGKRAMRLVRCNAREWGIDPDRIGMMGFSAGGHLASTVATHFDPGDPKAADPIDRVDCRPDFLVLVYPVISMGPKGHAGSRDNLLGSSPTPELVEWLSSEKHVTAQTPPTFLAHAKTDTGVSVENSALFHAAMKAHGVPCEFLELPTGEHGLGCGKGNEWTAWQDACLHWLRAQGVAAELERETLAAAAS